jgi:hypothetical protein
MPGQSKKYYIFTTGGKLSYTIIDMALRGGLGDVSGHTNVLLQDTCARITGTFISGNAGTWVVVHLLFSNAFYAYPVTQAGIGTPVISYQGDIDRSAAYLKMSPDGSMICAIFNWSDSVYTPAHPQVFRFDNSTGVVSPPFFTDISSYTDYVGLSFSPNSRLLYAGAAMDSVIYQYDLYAGNDSAILASKNRIGTPYHPNNNIQIAAMQIAADQKIYVAIGTSYPTPWLDAIDNPNVYGNACNYHSQAVPFYNLPGGFLPVFNDHIFVPDSIMHVAGYVTKQAVSCVGSCSGRASVTAFYGHPPYTYHWQPGNLSTRVIDNLCSGTYYVTVTDSIGQSFSESIQIPLVDTPHITISGDTSGLICGRQYAAFHLHVPEDWYVDYTYAWNSGQMWSDIYPASGGTYSCTVTDPNGCKAVSTPIVLSFHTPPSATANVVGDTLQALTNDSVSYQWYFNGTIINGATNYFCDSTQPGVYTVNITDTNGCSTSLRFGPYLDIAPVLKETFSIYPNPNFLPEWRLSVDESLIGAPVEIYDSKGSLIFKTKIESATSLVQLDVSKGVYFLYLYSPDGLRVRRLIRL